MPAFHVLQVGGAKGLVDDFNEAPTVTKGLLAGAAVAGAGVFLFSQVGGARGGEGAP